MPFDQGTRNRLQRFVSDARALLTEEFTRQIQKDFGMDPKSGEVTGLDRLGHLDDARLETAKLLREILAHYLASDMAKGQKAQKAALDRIVREQAFTVLNRLAALRMMEARGLLRESVGNGYQSTGFQLYERLAGHALGETGAAYRVYLESLFDELAVDLKVLFDRYSPQGRLFPGETALLKLLDLINDPEIESLWAEDETIGWVYQYFNSKEERKKMRDESAAPRNSRELAVRNQFFTPRYVVEFLVDNTLGRKWFDLTGGQTSLYDRCQYLLAVGSGQNAVGSGQRAECGRQKAEGSGERADCGRQKAEGGGEGDNLPTAGRILPTSPRDPRTIKLLDPACGSMHFGLYAFDLFEVIYREAWEWEEECGRQRADGSGQKGGDDDGEELSGSASLAEGNGSGGSGVPGDQAVSVGREVRTYESGSSGGGIDPVEHCGGAGPTNGGGFHQVPVDRSRLVEGGRNPGDDRSQTGVHLSRGGEIPVGLSSRSRAAATRTDQQTVAVGLDTADTEGTTAYCPLPSAYYPLHSAYSSREALLLDVPRLIIERNIFGVEIDPRAAQIASLALWLRAQRAWNQAGVKSQDRPLIRKSNVIAAVAPPTEKDLRERFASGLNGADAELFERSLVMLKGLPELGVLLRIERELPDLIRRVYGEHGPMFREQDTEQWQAAESRLREALEDFVHAARSGYQGRLFAQDALEGLRLMDLTREQFDVVVMNPPFGPLSHGAKSYLSAYPDSDNDLLGIFVERGLELLRRDGFLGAITSRTCFFLTSFADWREKVVLARSAVKAIADLGQGVMDAAMVEAAAYVLQRAARTSTIPVIRAISDADRQEAVDRGVAGYRRGTRQQGLFLAQTKTFDLLPDSPLVYWVEPQAIERFASELRFEPDVGTVRVGVQTGDDPRFVRAVWEVAPEDTQFCYYPTDGSDFCRFDDPVVGAYLRRRNKGMPRWAFHVKAGASQPWYSPITLKLKYEQNGTELRSFRDSKGKPRAYLRSQGHYYRPGFSWTRRAVRLYPYLIPGNCIPSVSRYMAFPEHGKQAEALGVCASRLVSAFLRFYAEFWQRPNFLVENVKMLPWPPLDETAHAYFSALVAREVEARRQAYRNFEPFHEFVVPARVRDYSQGGRSLAFDPVSLLGEEGERLVADAYGFTSEQAAAVERDLREAIAYQRGGAYAAEDEGGEAENADFVLDTSPRTNAEALVSYLVGCAFGRWDVRFATGEKHPESPEDPFAPLPVCPPGMLQGEDGLPARANDIPVDYPLPIAWNGVLAEDEGHPADVVQRIRIALNVIWQAHADREEEALCAELGIGALRDHIKRPSRFFASHVKCYSKSARKAPIYWPLATASGSYTLWVYYPSLTSQTLYTAVNDFVEPKLAQVRAEIGRLKEEGSKQKAEGRRGSDNLPTAHRLLPTVLQDLELELTDLRDTLLAIAPDYKPNHDDGVQITAAPLWPLFRHKPWQKVLKETWQKLEKGDYDWAHLAYTYWPERVREKCRTDKSLAIAHGLEELYEEPPEQARRPRRSKK